MQNKSLESFIIGTFKSVDGKFTGKIYDFVTGNFPFAFEIDQECRDFHNSGRARSERVLEFLLRGRVGEISVEYNREISYLK